MDGFLELANVSGMHDGEMRDAQLDGHTPMRVVQQEPWGRVPDTAPRS